MSNSKIEIILLTILSIFISNTRAEIYECFFKNCFCTQINNNNVNVECTPLFKSNGEFPNKLTNSNDSNLIISKISFYSLSDHFQFTEIPSNSFYNLTIDQLEFREINKFEKLSASSFNGIKSLKKLRLHQTSLYIVESNTFSPIKDTLTEIEISNCSLRTQEIDWFINELKIFKNLKTLKLDQNLIQYVRQEWFETFTNLEMLSLASNQISNLTYDIFKFNTKLINVDLSHNSFTDLNIIQSSFISIKNKIQVLKLSENNLNQLSEFNQMDSLNVLDLSNLNFKNNISEKAFSNLKQLNKVNLENNGISFFPDRLFESNRNLEEIYLANNYLLKIPKIENLTKLKILDLSNQIGYLKAIEDYAFDRRESEYLTIYLVQNQIIKFSPKAFCSKLKKSINILNLIIDYTNLKEVNKCLLKQLQSFDSMYNTKIIVSDPSFYVEKDKTIFTNVCNCEQYNYLKKFRIDLAGICSDYDYSKCLNNSLENDECLNKTDFICDSMSLNDTQMITSTQLTNIKTDFKFNQTTEKNISINTLKSTSFYLEMTCLMFILPIIKISY